MTQRLPKSQNRHIRLEGADNIRDLGGYMTKDGKMTKWRKYIRGDSLHKLSVRSQSFLQDELGVRNVVDLRHPNEGTYQFHESLNIQYLNVPLNNPEELKNMKDLTEAYCNIIDSRQDSIYQVMKHFVSAEKETVLFHCRSGKDRTGIFAAMLLDLVEVPHETIIEDYARTAQHLQLNVINSNDIPSSFTLDQYKAFRQCRPEYMQEFLTYLYKHYQNSEEYLKHIGLNQEEVNVIKKNFVV